MWGEGLARERRRGHIGELIKISVEKLWDMCEVLNLFSVGLERQYKA